LIRRVTAISGKSSITLSSGSAAGCRREGRRQTLNEPISDYDHSGAFCSAASLSGAPGTLIRLFEAPSRQQWQKPQQVVERLSIQPGDVVADIGVWTGYFSVLLAEKVGKNGTVFAVDIDRNMAEFVRQRAKKGLTNVSTVLALELPN